MRTIADLQVDVERKLHGTTLSKVQGEFSLYNEAARAVLNDVDFWETKRIAQIANAIFTDVFDYALPSDLKGNKIIDIRPQVNRGLEDFPRQVYNVTFDRRKLDQDFTIRDNSGVRTLRFSTDTGTMTLLHAMDSITNNGTWIVGDDATNLTLDTLNFISGNGSLNFDTTGVGTTASISNTTIEPVDVSALEDIGSLFLFIFMPVAITDATLDWGDNLTTDFWSDTVTTPQNGSFQVGWNLIRFDWNGAIKTGSPDAASVNALKVSITYDGNVDTDYRVDNITVQLGEIFEISYYSKFLFKTAAGAFIEETTDNSDEIVLDLEGYNTFLYKVLELAAPQIQAEDARFDLQLYVNQYELAKRRYKAKYKSEIRLPVNKYYRRSITAHDFFGQHRGGHRHHHDDSVL